MNRQHFSIILGGILFLAVAMGISRFAFTPILPFMRVDENLSFTQGGWLASGQLYRILHRSFRGRVC